LCNASQAACLNDGGNKGLNLPVDKSPYNVASPTAWDEMESEGEDLIFSTSGQIR
jgi:hypothetical protein